MCRLASSLSKSGGESDSIMALDPQYEVGPSSPAAGTQIVSQVFPGYPVYNGTAGTFPLVLMGLTTSGGSQRWYFTVWGIVDSPYYPDPMRFLQVDPDTSDPVGAYAAEGSGGAPDPTIGSGSIGEWP